MRVQTLNTQVTTMIKTPKEAAILNGLGTLYIHIFSNKALFVLFVKHFSLYTNIEIAYRYATNFAIRPRNHVYSRSFFFFPQNYGTVLKQATYHYLEMLDIVIMFG